MIRIINGDCMDYLHTIADNSVNLVICDLPYGMTDLKWDKKIDLATLWVEIKRVLDPTAGSGTVIEACVKLNRDVIAIELDPKQYGVCIKRACIDVQKDLI
jgi:DNA modification methylase